MALTKSEIAASLAETVGLTKEQAAQTLEALAALAYKNAKDSFTIPGLGKLVLVDRTQSPAGSQSCHGRADQHSRQACGEIPRR